MLELGRNALKKRSYKKRKPKPERNDAELHIRCRSIHKKQWVKASSGNLSQWVIDTLNKESDNAQE